LTKLIEEVVDEGATDAIVEVEDDVAVEAICGTNNMKKSLDLQANHKKSIECSRTNSEREREREFERKSERIIIAHI